MAKKSRALRELEAMEYKERRELEIAEGVRNAVAARLDTIQTLKRKLEEAPKVKAKPRSDKVVRRFNEEVAKAAEAKELAVKLATKGQERFELPV